MRTGAVGKPARRVFPGATGVLRIRFVIVYRIGDCERVCLATAPGLSQTARFTVGRLVHGRGGTRPQLRRSLYAHATGNRHNTHTHSKQGYAYSKAVGRAVLGQTGRNTVFFRSLTPYEQHIGMGFKRVKRKISFEFISHSSVKQSSAYSPQLLGWYKFILTK